MFSVDLAERQDRVATLVEVGPEAVQLLVDYLYTGPTVLPLITPENVADVWNAARSENEAEEGEEEKDDDEEEGGGAERRRR